MTRSSHPEFTSFNAIVPPTSRTLESFCDQEHNESEHLRIFDRLSRAAGQ